MSNFFLSVIVMAVLAGILAGLLSIAYSKLKVEKDPRVEKIEELLPGVNCGVCGFASCQEFAEKLIKHEVSVEKCKITARNKEAAEKIEKIARG
jgi:Na+-translocating ferredoxin:NAD+ oxidoreductase subunit B